VTLICFLVTIALRKLTDRDNLFNVRAIVLSFANPNKQQDLEKMAHQRYSVGVILIYTLVASVGFTCNVAVIVSILKRPMRTPNVRYVLMLTSDLFLEQVFSFPQIYVRYNSLCAATDALENYLEMMMLCAGVCMSILSFYQLFKCVECISP
jgi:hypothetical protein